MDCWPFWPLSNRLKGKTERLQAVDREIIEAEQLIAKAKDVVNQLNVEQRETAMLDVRERVTNALSLTSDDTHAAVVNQEFSVPTDILSRIPIRQAAPPPLPPPVATLSAAEISVTPAFQERIAVMRARAAGADAALASAGSAPAMRPAAPVVAVTPQAPKKPEATPLASSFHNLLPS